MKLSLKILLPVLAGLLLLLVPLLRDLHFESAMLAGAIGCFWAGLRSADHSSKRDFFPALKILGYIYLAGLPLFIYSLFTSCLTIDGFGFWVLIPLPSVFFGAGIGRLIRKFGIPYSKSVTVLILLFCAVGILLIEFFNFPQVYFYNHIWGLWPGPIYDESVNLSGSLFYFRWITFLWIILFWVLPAWNKNQQTKLIAGFALLSLMFSYLNLNEAGIISPRESIQKKLGGYHQTTHFDLYYDDTVYSEDEIEYWSARHEFHFQQITEQLEIDWPAGRKIESYLYAHAWQKKKITGAKFTSYVPIWLDQDQLHIAKQQLDRVLKHELVHVISKQFGNRLFNGSWSIGLIEGLAEGIAKDASPRSTLHQIVAAEKPFPSAEQMKSAFSFWGFYKSAGAISYTTTGSFVEYLLAEFPPENIKQAYSSGDIAASYDFSFEELISGWHQRLRETEIDSVDQQISELIFSQRSLFQKLCPHSFSKELRLWDDYQFFMANQDTLLAFETLNQLYKLDSQNDLIKSEWVRSQLLQQNYGRAVDAITPKDTLLTLQILKADALFLNGEFFQADSLLQRIAPKIDSSSARNLAYSLELREDSLQWNYHTQRRYLDLFPGSTKFNSLNLPNKMLSLNKALQKNMENRSILYAKSLTAHDPDTHWFDIYEATIHRLAFLGEVKLARQWLQIPASLDLRLRYFERLQEQQEWINFIDNKNTVAEE